MRVSKYQTAWIPAQLIFKSNAEIITNKGPLFSIIKIVRQNRILIAKVWASIWTVRSLSTSTQIVVLPWPYDQPCPYDYPVHMTNLEVHDYIHFLDIHFLGHFLESRTLTICTMSTNCPSYLFCLIGEWNCTKMLKRCEIRRFKSRSVISVIS